MSSRHVPRSSSSHNLTGDIDGTDVESRNGLELATSHKHPPKTIGYKLCWSVRLMAIFLFTMAYIAGDLVFSDAAFKATEATSYLVPYVGKRADNISSSDGELSASEAADTYCASPFFGFDSIYWLAAKAEAGNFTVGGGTRPASTTRCTVGTVEKPLHSAHVRQSGTTSSIFFTTLSVKADGGGKADHLTSPERFYALNPEYQALGFVVASARVSDGKIVPPTAIYSSTTGEQITTSSQGYGWETMRDLFLEAKLPIDVLNTRRNNNATGPTFRESGLSIQVTITFRNYPLTFDEIDPWMAGTLHVADMSFSHQTTSYMSRGRNAEPLLVRDAQGGGGTWHMVEAVEYGVQVRFIVQAKGIQFAIQKGTGSIMSSPKDNAKLFFAIFLAIARLIAIVFSLTMSWRFFRGWGRLWCGCCPEKKKVYLAPGKSLQMISSGDVKLDARGGDSAGGKYGEKEGKNGVKGKERKSKRDDGSIRKNSKEKTKPKPSSKSKTPSSKDATWRSSGMMTGDVEMSQSNESRMAKDSRQQMYQAPSARVPGAVIIAGNAAMDEASGLSWDFSQTMLARQRQAFGLANDNTHRHYMGPSTFEPELPNLHDVNLHAFGRPAAVGSVAELGNPGSSFEMVASGGAAQSGKEHGFGDGYGTNHHSISQALAIGGYMKFVQPKEVAMLKLELLERIKRVEEMWEKFGVVLQEAQANGSGMGGTEGKKMNTAAGFLSVKMPTM